MCETDGSPSEECSETRQCEEPVEDCGRVCAKSDVGNETAEENRDSREQRTTCTIDVVEDAWGIALLSEGSESTRSSIDTTVSDRDDRDENNEVQEGIESNKTSILGGNDEGGGSGVDKGLGAEEAGVGGGDEETHEEKTDNVEDCDSPEDLLNCSRKVVCWVLRLCGGQSNQLGSGEGESCCHKNRADSLETVLERTGC